MTAIEIYKTQNKILHEIFERLKMPYAGEKQIWLDLFATLFKRQVNGLSEMTLRERDRLIKYLDRTYTYRKLPIVSPDIAGWKKGDENITSSEGAGGDAAKQGGLHCR